MNDRYLFKAKRIDNGEWIAGNLVYSEDADEDFRAIIISTKYSDMYTDRKEKDLGFENWCKVDLSTLCQCTGLKDKNGTLIWENDICDRKVDAPGIVNYNSGNWQLDYSYAYGKERGYSCYNLGFYADERKCVEVIGNIFDNPELLEVE